VFGMCEMSSPRRLPSSRAMREVEWMGCNQLSARV
jgi:hypothetical protein